MFNHGIPWKFFVRPIDAKSCMNKSPPKIVILASPSIEKITKIKILNNFVSLWSICSTPTMTGWDIAYAGGWSLWRPFCYNYDLKWPRISLIRNILLSWIRKGFYLSHPPPWELKIWIDAQKFKLLTYFWLKIFGNILLQSSKINF